MRNKKQEYEMANHFDVPVKKQIVIVLNCNLPTLNEYIASERSDKFMAAKMKAENTEKVKFLAKCNYKGTQLTGCYDIEIEWFRNDQKDHDNVAFATKFIFDGLVVAKILKNDNPTHIRDISHKFLKTEIGYNYQSVKLIEV